MRKVILATPVLLFLACSGEAPEDPSATEAPAFDITKLAIAPAGSDAAFVSSTVPATMAPGERLNVSVTMRNTGTASPANDWPTNYLLYRQNSLWSWVQTATGIVAAASPTQDTVTFNQVLTAPTAPGVSNFRAQMLSTSAGQSGFFGDVVDIPVTVDATRRPAWGCALESSNLPATLEPGERFSASITVRNVGTETWTGSSFCLLSRDTPYALWGSPCVTVTTPVTGATQGGPDSSGATHTFNFDIVAPNSGSGPTSFRRQMYQSGSAASGAVNFFDLASNCVDVDITIGTNAPWDSSFVAGQSDIDDSTTYAPGERRIVTAAFDNDGTEDWTVGQVILYSRNTPTNLWGPRNNFPLLADAASGATGTFRFVVTAPVTPGPYTHSWQTFSNTPAFFGEQIDIPVTVSAGAQRQYDATVVSQVLQTPIATVRPGVFRITMRNTGFATWQAGRVRLASQNSPVGVWGVGGQTLTTNVPPGSAHEFVLNVQGPATPGSYQSRWRLEEFGDRLGFFGAQAQGTVDVVAIACGNNTVEGNEQCDDGNTTNGDGCSSTCQIENTTVDLATQAAGRTFYNDVGGRDFGKVAIGDVNGDGIADVAMGSWATVQPAGAAGRALAGRVHVYSGAGFFTGATTRVDESPMLTVLGARSNDILSGQVEGRILIRDVTGDGAPDLVVSAAFAACQDNTGSCGRVYVIAGGPQLDTVPNATIDLLTSPFVTARIVGATPGVRASAVTSGDLDGDGVRDLVVGLNTSSPLGRASAGTFSVIRGGLTLTGTIAATGSANVISEIYGANANDRLGLIAAVGQVDGAGGNDLVVGAPGYDSGTGGADAGGVFVINSPLPATVDLGAVPREWNARFRGAGVRDYLGSDVAVADLLGSTAPDLVMGVTGARTGATRFGSADFFVGPIVDGTDIDYSVGPNPASTSFLGANTGDSTGACFGVGQMTGDQRADLTVVAQYASGAANGLTQAGEAYVLPGGAAGPLVVDAGIVNLAPGAESLTVFGATNANRMCFYKGYVAIGDIDGDDRDDLCLGSAQGDTVPASGLARPGRLDCFRSPW